MIGSPEWPEDGYVMEVPVISSSHLCNACIGFLIEEGTDFFGICARYVPDGFFVLVEDIDGENLEDVPEPLKNILKWASENRIPWIRFDKDAGEVIEGFPVFDVYLKEPA